MHILTLMYVTCLIVVWPYRAAFKLDTGLPLWHRFLRAAGYSVIAVILILVTLGAIKSFIVGCRVILMAFTVISTGYINIL